MGNCHPCRMDVDQVLAHRQRQNEKAQIRDKKRERRQVKKNQKREMRNAKKKPHGTVNSPPIDDSCGY